MKKDSFPTLDLHGVRHEQASRIIEDFILEKIDDLPIAVITGHSDYYQELLSSLAKNCELYFLPQCWRNPGCWIVTESKNGSNNLFA